MRIMTENRQVTGKIQVIMQLSGHLLIMPESPPGSSGPKSLNENKSENEDKKLKIYKLPIVENSKILYNIP